VLSALKLIEQISYVQLDEFYLHQWIFVLDCKINIEFWFEFCFFRKKEKI